MKPRRLYLTLMLLLALSGLLLIPHVHWSVYGWLRGEAFYQGMPTSWWAQEIEGSYYADDLSVLHCRSELPPARTVWYRVVRPSLASQMQDLIRNGRISALDRIYSHGTLLDGDPSAMPVLVELLNSDSAMARRVAISGLCWQPHDGHQAVPALLKAIEDLDDEVRQDAMAALKVVDREAATKAGVSVK